MVLTSCRSTPVLFADAVIAESSWFLGFQKLVDLLWIRQLIDSHLTPLSPSRPPVVVSIVERAAVDAPVLAVLRSSTLERGSTTLRLTYSFGECPVTWLQA